MASIPCASNEVLDLSRPAPTGMHWYNVSVLIPDHKPETYLHALGHRELNAAVHIGARPTIAHPTIQKTRAFTLTSMLIRRELCRLAYHNPAVIDDLTYALENSEAWAQMNLPAIIADSIRDFWEVDGQVDDYSTESDESDDHEGRNNSQCDDIDIEMSTDDDADTQVLPPAPALVRAPSILQRKSSHPRKWQKLDPTADLTAPTQNPFTQETIMDDGEITNID